MNKYIEEYCNLIQKSLDSASFTLYEKNLTGFDTYIQQKEQPVQSLREGDIRKYVESLIDKKLSNSTINQNISTLRGLYDYLEKNYNIKNPMLNITNLSIIRDKGRLDNDESSKILNFLENDERMEVRDRLILILIVQHGFRGLALCKLDKKNIVERESKIEIIQHNKNILIESPNTFNLYNRYKKERADIKSDYNNFFLTKKGEILKKPHIVYMAKRMAQFTDLSTSSLSFLSRTQKSAPERELIDTRYEVEKILKRGEKFKILKVTDKKENHNYKLIKLTEITEENKEYIEQIKSEYKFLKELNHANIIKVHDINQCKSASFGEIIYLVMEFLQGVPIVNLAGRIGIEDFLDISLGLLSALSLIHKKGFVHADIKSENIIIVKKDSKYIPKFIDLGLACCKDEKLKTARGTLPYVAPELFKLKYFDKRADIFSLGVTLFYLLTKELPFKIKAGEIVRISECDLSKIRSDLPDIIVKTVNRMIDEEIENRFMDAESCVNQLKSLRSSKSESTLEDLHPLEIKQEREIATITKSILALKSGRNFNPLITIRGGENTGKSKLLDEIKRISAINSIRIYNIDLKKQNDAKILADIFLNEKEQDDTLPGMDFNANRITLFAKTFNNINKDAPAILAIDNFDRGNKEFYDFFLFILKQQIKQRERILFIIAYDPATFSEKGKIDFFKQNFVNSADLLNIELFPLTKEELEGKLKGWTNLTVKSEIIDYIFSKTEGKISKIIDLTNFLLKKGFFYIDSSKSLAFSRTFYDFHEKDLIKNILKESNLVLNIVATFGDNIDISFLQCVTSSILNQDVDLSIILEPLLNQKILQNREGKILFENKYFASLYYKHIPAKQIEEIHNKIGILLEKKILNPNEWERNKITEHFYKGHNSQKSFYYLMKKSVEYRELGLLRDSLESINRLTGFFDEYSDREKIELLLLKIGILTDLLELKKARTELKRAGELIKEGKDSISLLHLEARILLKDGKINEALLLCDKLLNSLSLPIRADISHGNTDGQNKADRGATKSRSEAYFQYVAATRRGSNEGMRNYVRLYKNQEIYINVSILKISSLIQISKYQEAVNFILPIIDSEFDKSFLPQVLTLKNLMGLSLFYIGEYGKAKEIFLELLNGSMDYKKIHLTVLHNMGTLHYQLCDFTEASKCFNEAQKLSDTHFDILSKAMVLINIASIEHRLGNMKMAIQSYEEAYEIYSSLGEMRNYENLLLGLGLIYANIGMWEKAKNYAKLSCEFAQNRSNKVILGYTYALYADIERGEKRYENALTFYNQSIEIFSKFNLKKELCQALLHRVETRLLIGNTNEAFDSLENARNIKDIAQFPDTSLRITLHEILYELKRETIRYSEINTKINTLKGNIILKQDWELHLRFLKVLSEYQKIIGEEVESEETLQKMKNRMRDMISGFSRGEQENFLKRSEFGLFIKECEEKESKSEIERLLEINLEISENLEIEILLHKILSNILILSSADLVYLVLKNERGKFIPSAVLDKSGNRIEKYKHIFSKKLLNEVIKREGALIINNMDGSDRAQSKSMKEINLLSVIALPLTIRREIIGVLFIENRAQRNDFNAKNLKLYSLFASQAAIAIENARHYNSVKSENRALIDRTSEIENELTNKSVFIDSHERILKYSYSEIIGHSPKIISVLNILDKIVESNISVLIEGESGTGKELIARAIHKNSERRSKPFMAENCAVFSETILEGELFGHTKGSFTDATTDKGGIFEAADGGTVFLDEVGEMSPEMQKKLLRFLQTGEFRRIGEDRIRRVDVRIVSATNRNLKRMISDGTFREDLYYRLNVISIALPPLRERTEDIQDLVNYFIKRYNRAKNEDIVIEDEVIEMLMTYNWPGNIRELENEITRLIVLRDGNRIDKRLIGDDLRYKSKL